MSSNQKSTPNYNSGCEMENNFEDSKLKIEMYETFRSYVRHEDGLINIRLTWILTIHGFLFATYGFTLQKKIEIISKFALDGHIADDVRKINTLYLSNLKDTFFHIEIFLFMIAVVGILISWLGHQSIKMANTSLYSLMDIFRENYEISERCISKGENYEIVKYRISDKKFLPDITGGGTHMESEITKAPLHIAKILILSWLVAISVSGYFIYKDPSLYGLHFSRHFPYLHNEMNSNN